MTAWRARIHLSTHDRDPRLPVPGPTCPRRDRRRCGMDGWIQFQTSARPSSPTLPPDRAPGSGDFNIDFGDRIRASFDVIIGDPQVANAIKTATLPPPPSSAARSTATSTSTSRAAARPSRSREPHGHRRARGHRRDRRPGPGRGRRRPPARSRGRRDAADGRATFVPLAAPGERVRAASSARRSASPGPSWSPSSGPAPTRVPPPCPLFGSCGGCQWQHVTIEAQRAAKKAIVERALGVGDRRRCARRGHDFGYRDRAKLTVGQGGALGFHARRSHDVVDVPACPLLGPELARALPALRALARGLRAGAELEVQAGAEGVHLNVSRTDAGRRARRREIDRLNAAGSWACARRQADARRRGGRRHRAGRRAAARSPRAASRRSAAPRTPRWSPPCWRPSGEPGVVLELYAGSGTFTRHLVGRGRRRGASPATAIRRRSRAAARNAPGAAWSRARRPISPDTVVLDPPREGADRATSSRRHRARAAASSTSRAIRRLWRATRATSRPTASAWQAPSRSI